MKLYIWGTGRLVGKVLGKYIKEEQVSGFIDNNVNIVNFMGKKVISPQQLKNEKYDVIIVCNMYSKSIYQQSIQLGIDVNKMIFLYANISKVDMNKDYKFVESILGEEYKKIIRNRYHMVRNLELQEKLCFEDMYSKDGDYSEVDWVRIKNFELIVKEIRKRNIAGSVAELGVFKGDFAKYINYAFPKDKFYLFDTFEGFDVKEAVKEKQKGNCTEAFIQSYKNAEIEEVINKMTSLDRIIVKQGKFPQSLNGLEDEFKFVSIDLDFEDSIYSGIEYFYPRLVNGGYIFIHDYNSYLRGVEKAIERYEKKYGWLCKVPICDASGTIVITKV